MRRTTTGRPAAEAFANLYSLSTIFFLLSFFWTMFQPSAFWGLLNYFAIHRLSAQPYSFPFFLFFILFPIPHFVKPGVGYL